MSDEQLYPREFIEELKAKEPRWREVELAAKVEAELRDSDVLKVVLTVINERAVVAMDKLVTADPTDAKLIMTLQARVQCARIIGETLEAVRQKGALAAASLVEDDRQGLLMNEEGKPYDDQRG